MVEIHCLGKGNIFTLAAHHKDNGTVYTKFIQYRLRLKIPCLLVVISWRRRLRLAIDSVMAHTAGAINKQTRLPGC